MAWTTGKYQTTNAGGEAIRAFVPDPLPLAKPELVLEGKLAAQHTDAAAAVARQSVAGTMVPNADWFLYGFVRK